MYDVIIAGARVAGSATALLLARQGLRVLVVDRAAFPSDTLSTHVIHLPGVACLQRWGVLDQVAASNAPPVRHLRFDPGTAVLDGLLPTFQGVDAVFVPRRTVLDKLLIDAARAAGAEVRERFTVEEVLVDDGTVQGIRGHDAGGGSVDERARIVIGADGKHSLVAKTVKAATYHERPVQTMGYYAYWRDVPVVGAELYGRNHRTIGAWPTNDGLLMTYIAWPADEFHAFRADIEGNFLRTLDLAGTLGERIRAGQRADRFYGSIDLPNFFRKPFGPGWALVGDAGLAIDPITARGISDAFRDAELLAHAIVAGLSGRQPLAGALAGYETARNRAALPMYRFTGQLASFKPSVAAEVLFDAIAGRPAETTRFFGVMTGATPLPAYMTPTNLIRLIGLRGMARMIGRQVQASRAPARRQLAPA